MTALPERAAACGAAERPTDILSLCAALALCGEAIVPSLDLGDAKAIKPQSADSGLDVGLYVALIRRGCERARFGTTVSSSHRWRNCPTVGTLVTTGPRAAFRISSTHRLWTISRVRPYTYLR
jgi:hypothetical protein